MSLLPRWLLLFVAFVVIGCGSSKPQDLIVGKWKGKEKVDATKGGGKAGEVDVAVEFLKDGTMKINVGGQEIPAKYKFLDDNTIEMEVTFMGMTQKSKSKVSVTKDTLTETDESGKVTTLTRQ